jgi:pimeloyl-ACP methyl ester carboxylesterase/DNA-binding winged helix-turn-helix (wHTH) protein
MEGRCREAADCVEIGGQNRGAGRCEMIYSFDRFVLDTRRCELRAGEERLHLEPQVYAVLCYLVEQRDRMVRKEELLDRIWGHRFVAPTTLNSRIKSLRQALDDDGSRQRIIRTVRGAGFRFVAPVVEEGAVGAPADPTRGGPDRPGVEPGGREGSGPASRRAAPPPLRLLGHDAEGRPLEQHIRFCRGHDGIRIAYATSGSGPPLLKPANWLTHLEYDWNSPVWRHWLKELSRDHTLIRYDERGSGLSDGAAEDVSFDMWIRDLERLVDEMELDRVPLIALSQGCAVAVAFAALHPERVSRLVLYGGYLQGRFRRPATPLERAQSEVMLQMLSVGWGHDNPAFRQFFATLFLPEGTPEQTAWFRELQRVSASAANAVRLWKASAEIDVCDLAPLVKAPTMVIHVTGDAVVPFEEGRRLAGMIPGARFVPLEGRNHVLLEWEPAWPRFLEEARAFLAEEAPTALSSATPRFVG